MKKEIDVVSYIRPSVMEYGKTVSSLVHVIWDGAEVHALFYLFHAQ